MPEGMEHIFDRMPEMLRKLKKASYKSNMEAFLEEHRHRFVRMILTAATSDDPGRTAGEIADAFVDCIEAAYFPGGKRNARTRTDMTFFMIYYVFPAILKIGEEGGSGEAAAIMADALCGVWSDRISDHRISYTTYDRLYETFREKIFGIF